MADLFAKIDPQIYEEYVTMKNVKKFLYVRPEKSLYGTVKADLLLYKNLTGKIKGWVFELDSYDTYVANKTINGGKCTIIWHVDDLKISHVDSKVVDSIINIFGQEFGIYAPLTSTQGKIHNYLGIVIDCTTHGKVVFNMFDYIKTCLICVE